jgi:hypothetical protein
LISGNPFNRAPLLGQFTFDRKLLIDAMQKVLPVQAARCYERFTQFLDARVKPAAWSGTIIAGNEFPTGSIVGNPDLQKAVAALQSQRERSFNATREFALQVLNHGEPPQIHLGRFVARLWQPVVSSRYSLNLEGILGGPGIGSSLDDLRCNEANSLQRAQLDLLCVGLLPGSPNPPLSTRLEEILSNPLIGPESYWMIDTGLVSSTISDFALYDRNNGTFSLVSSDDISNFSKNGPTQKLRDSSGQMKGRELLSKLQWLAEASVLQQSVANGDYTVQLMERELYDSSRHTLISNLDLPNLPNDAARERKRLALVAMKGSPTLARNVLMLAMRHAIEDSLGGPSKAEELNYRQTYYQLALADFAPPKACNKSADSIQKLQELFGKSWGFEYRATSTEPATGAPGCQQEIVTDLNNAASPPAAGHGIAVNLGDFCALVHRFLGTDHFRRIHVIHDGLYPGF